MAAVVKVKGIALDLGGATFVVPPLSLGALEQLQESLSSFSGDVTDKAQVATAIDAAHAALRRNYPAMTREEVAEAIGLDNMVDVMEAVMDVSGLKRKQLEAAEGAGPGEG
jgi:hypothetical protein